VPVKRWLQAADLSMSRVGLLLVGDIEIAWRAIQREPRAPGDLTPAQWRAEMLAFQESDTYAELREAIGVALRRG
jgi:hypothetical protein